MENLSMFLGRFDWANLSAILAIAGGLYRFIHKDFLSLNKEIDIMKETQNSFREEMKEIKEKSRLTDLRIDGIYTILMKKYGGDDKK